MYSLPLFGLYLESFDRCVKVFFLNQLVFNVFASRS